MAIEMKIKTPLIKIAQKAGMSTELCAMATGLDSVGVKIVTSANTIKLKLDDDTLATAMFKPEVLNMLLEGKLGPAGKKIFIKSMEDTIIGADAYIEKEYPVDLPDTSCVEADPGGVIADLTAAKLDQSATPGMGEAVPLRSATKLMEPVRGTDQKSVYFAIALGHDANVGARVTSKRRVSFRVEGPHLEPHNKTLQDAGFTKSKQGHWSIHVECGDADDMVKKAVGAMLFATGIEFDEVSMNVIDLKGKGGMMNSPSQILEIIEGLNVGEGFEVGTLFHNLPGDEKIFWRLDNATGKTVKKFKFSLHYYGVHIRSETLVVRNGELQVGL